MLYTSEARMGYLKTARKRYFLEVVAAFLLVFAAVRLRIYAIQHTTDTALRIAVQLLPLLPMLLVMLAIWRLYRARDERQQQTILRTSAAAIFLSLFVLMAYPGLHMLGLPPFNAARGLLLLAGSCMLCGLVFAFLR